MADVDADVVAGAAAGGPKKRTFKKFSFRGVDLDALLDMSTDELVKLFHARPSERGLKRKPMALIKKLQKAGADINSCLLSSGQTTAEDDPQKREALAGEKPEPVQTPPSASCSLYWR